MINIIKRYDCYFYNAFCGDDENADCDWHGKNIEKIEGCENCPYFINENIADLIIRGRVADRIANYIEYGRRLS